MQYFIKRDLNEFGPYTLSDLQRYIASGNILLTDLARSEGMSDWVPVPQVIGTIPVPAPATFAPPAAPAVIYPDPPSLHWAVVLLLGVVTCGLFGWVWALIQASFVKKIDPASKAVVYYAIALGLFIASGVMGASSVELRGFAPLFNLAGAVMWVFASFNMRSSLEVHYNTNEPIALLLGPVMTFFFSIYYFQYHLTKIHELRNRRALGAAGV